MNATTEVAPSADELRAQLAEHQERLAAARSEIGAATLDGSSTATATKRAKEAQAAIDAVESALAELERRLEEEDQEAAEAARSARRKQSYEWCAEYFRRVEIVLRAQAELRRVEDELKALGPDSAIHRQVSGRSNRDPNPPNVDLDGLSGLPYSWNQLPHYVQRLSEEACREKRALALARAAEQAPE